MFYLFVGTDRDKIRKEATTLRDGLLKKKPDAAVVKFSSDNVSVAEFESHISGQGLFNAASVIYADGIFSKEEVKDFFAKNVGAIAGSPNVFLLLEEKLDAATRKKIEPKAAKVVTHDIPEKKNFFAAREFNPFLLGDALVMRDKQKLFTLLHDAFRHDLLPEEISGMLFSSLRGMRIVLRVNTANEADMKPYPFQKARLGLSRWNRNDLEKASRDLVSLYHDAHRGKRDFALGLEKFVFESV